MSDDRARQVVSFLTSLERLDSVLRVIVSDARLRARFTVRGAAEQTVVLDMREVPARAVVDSGSMTADIHVAMSAEHWDAVLSGAMLPGEAYGRRQMLLRGSASDLARFIPLFDFAPLVYGGVARATPERREEEMRNKFARRVRQVLGRGALEQGLQVVMGRAAFVLGYGLGKARGRMDRLDLFSLLEAMSRGISAASRREDPHDVH